MLISLIMGHHYCDPQFYQYAGDFAVGKLPYRDVAVEYPPLALVVMIIPALPLLPFAGIAPRPDANPHPLHPDPARYGAYGISFAIFMLACDALTLWLVMRSARRLVPGDARGTWSGLLYAILIFASGAVLQKFDLIVGALCLAAVFALLASRDGLAWAALIAATLIKGFPLLLAPLFVLYRVAPLDQGNHDPSGDEGNHNPSGGQGNHKGLPLQTVRAIMAGIDWHALRRGAIGGGIVALAALVPAVMLGGVGGLVHSVAYHTSRGMEIESVPATVVLALGWLPGLGVTTAFDFADLSRDVRSPLVGPLDALATPVMLLLVLALYALFWYNRQRQTQHQTVMLGAATAVLLTFVLCFRALPLHYILSIAPLVALVRLPSRQQRWWLGMVLAACVAGNVVIGFWHQLVALTPGVALLLIARNAAFIAALVVLITGLLLPEGIRRKEVADDIRATNAPSSGERNHAVAP